MKKAAFACGSAVLHLLFVFRFLRSPSAKNEIQIKRNVPCCRRLKDVRVRHRVTRVIYWLFFRPARAKKQPTKDENPRYA
jgi:hypothetical protein